MNVSKASAVEDLIEQAQDCADIAADQHALADKQLATVKDHVSKQHENASKLEMLGEALVDEAVKKQGQQEMRRSPQGALIHRDQK